MRDAALLRAAFAQLIRRRWLRPELVKAYRSSPKDVAKYGIYVVWLYKSPHDFVYAPPQLLEGKRWEAAHVAVALMATYGKGSAFFLAVEAGAVKPPARPVRVVNPALARVAELYASGAACVVDGVEGSCDFDELYKQARQSAIHELFYAEDGYVTYAASTSYLATTCSAVR